MNAEDYFLSLYSDKSLRRWNKTAVECWLRNCVCKDCGIIEDLESVNEYTCKMKYAVILLVRKFGKPKPEDMEDMEDTGD